MADRRRLLSLLAASLALALAACAAQVQQSEPAPAPTLEPGPQPTVGGAEMDPAASILDNLSKSADHKTLVGAINGSGVADRLAAGSFTLFAPTDAAFAKLPPGTLETVSEPANRALLARLVNYHIVPGARTRARIAADVAAGGGSAVYRTLEGAVLRASLSGDRLILRDVHGNSSSVLIADVRNANGIVHVVDTLLLPAT